ncbi:hypothetical protein TrLO_g6990 [Triparma laevis f. longispina]|uniref:Concanavalin A-like lectin/glucanase domain-containing protein n=1 Tax=Triparma laevis f. longispina TaxID=1714387 RepID=A0A9W7FBH7_9STRA|nr:hypothetical protein TrLO_g6990 [Triparma laevis f. longispina]
MPSPSSLLVRRDSGPVHLYDDLVPLITSFMRSFETLSIAATLNKSFLRCCREQYEYLTENPELWIPSESRHFASHEWDFRRESPSPSPTVQDTKSSLLAHLHNSAYLSPSGLVLPPNSSSYATLPSWTWGGPTSIEVYLKFSKFNPTSHIFDFGSYSYSDRIFLCNFRTTSNLTLCIRKNHEPRYIDSNSNNGFEEDKWTHLVLTFEGCITKIHKNGKLVKTSTSSQEPEICERDAQTIGAYLKGDNFFFDGTIGFIRFYNGKIVESEHVRGLYNEMKKPKVNITKRIFLSYE